MAMQEHDTEVAMTLSYEEMRRILKQMRPASFVKLTAKFYHITDERPEERTSVYIYGDFPELPDFSFEL